MACAQQTLLQTNIDRPEGNDMRDIFTMRIKEASAPDGDYVTVTSAKTFDGITTQFPDFSLLEAGDYILHTYFTASGPTTGTKVTFAVACAPSV